MTSRSIGVIVAMKVTKKSITSITSPRKVAATRLVVKKVKALMMTYSEVVGVNNATVRWTKDPMVAMSH